MNVPGRIRIGFVCDVKSGGVAATDAARPWLVIETIGGPGEPVAGEKISQYEVDIARVPLSDVAHGDRVCCCRTWIALSRSNCLRHLEDRTNGAKGAHIRHSAVAVVALGPRAHTGRILDLLVRVCVDLDSINERRALGRCEVLGHETDTRTVVVVGREIGPHKVAGRVEEPHGLVAQLTFHRVGEGVVNVDIFERRVSRIHEGDRIQDADVRGRNGIARDGIVVGTEIVWTARGVWVVECSRVWGLASIALAGSYCHRSFDDREIQVIGGDAWKVVAPDGVFPVRRRFNITTKHLTIHEQAVCDLLGQTHRDTDLANIANLNLTDSKTYRIDRVGQRRFRSQHEPCIGLSPENPWAVSITIRRFAPFPCCLFDHRTTDSRTGILNSLPGTHATRVVERIATIRTCYCRCHTRGPNPKPVCNRIVG